MIFQVKFCEKKKREDVLLQEGGLLLEYGLL